MVQKINIDYNKYDYVDYGIDYLRLNFVDNQQYFEKIVNIINSTNTNFYIDGNITFVKFENLKGVMLLASVSYNDISVPIMCYTEFNIYTKMITGKMGRIDLYGSYFRLCQIGELELFNFDWLNSDMGISRIDYRIDLFNDYDLIKIPKVQNILNIRKNANYQLYKIGDTITNWQYGNKTSERIFYRFYDKKLDSEKKGKQFLYQDFFSFKTVHRFEMQFGNHFCKGYVFSDIYNLLQKIKNYIGGENNGCIFYKYDSKFEINNKYIQKFGSMANKIYINGKNPYLYLTDFLLKIKNVPKEDINKMLIQISDYYDLD